MSVLMLGFTTAMFFSAFSHCLQYPATTDSSKLATDCYVLQCLFSLASELTCRASWAETQPRGWAATARGAVRQPGNGVEAAGRGRGRGGEVRRLRAAARRAGNGVDPARQGDGCGQPRMEGRRRRRKARRRAGRSRGGISPATEGPGCAGGGQMEGRAIRGSCANRRTASRNDGPGSYLRWGFRKTTQLVC